MEPTLDPTVNITARTDEYKDYETIYGERWRIYGTCDACGLCENPPSQIPSVVQEVHIAKAPDGTELIWNRTLRWNALVGNPNAVSEDNFESRPDCPMRPEYVNNLNGCALTGEYLDGN